MYRMVELCLDRGGERAKRLPSPVEPAQLNGSTRLILGTDTVEVGDAGEKSPPERMVLVNISGGKNPPPLASWMPGYRRPPDDIAASTSRLVSI